MGAFKKSATTVALISDLVTDVLYIATTTFYNLWLMGLGIFFTCLPFMISVFITRKHDYREGDGKCDFIKKYLLKMIDHSFILKNAGYN